MLVILQLKLASDVSDVVAEIKIQEQFSAFFASHDLRAYDSSSGVACGSYVSVSKTFVVVAAHWICSFIFQIELLLSRQVVH
jgi:hypothetical protein